MDAAEIIEMLDLRPHPEGGHFREMFRDNTEDGSCHSTAIYYLLEQGDRSHWHRVHGSSEIWHFYAGAPLTLLISQDGKESKAQILGTSLITGERPQIIVPAGWWQSAESRGGWTLVGCTVAPGFEFENFEMAEPDWKPAADNNI